ncbi:MAG: DNA internalization-related competence protein ComEC/Rec2 [Clostridia bacterium]|nr:DNA internalization-related competence protein ComEC/Rec2 [Clostridia bacterium]
MNRPIVVILIGYIIGIIWGLYINKGIVLLYVFLAILYYIINHRYSKKSKFKILSIKRYFRYIKLIFKMNIVIIIVITSFISNNLIKYLNNKKIYIDNKIIQETGIIVDNKQEKEYKNRYKVKIKNDYFYLDTKKEVELEYGDKVLIDGRYKEPSIARNYKGFNYKQYLKSLKIEGIIEARKIEKIKKLCGNKIAQISNNIFLKIKKNIENTYNAETSKIILGIMLGDTEGIEEEIKEDFSKSNISHVLAISGMHISYIIYLVTVSTQTILGKRKSKIITIIILLMYMSITGFKTSILRAGIMGIINCMGFLVYRKSDTINNISIAALITLINNPFCVTNISFLLTYLGTLGIILFQRDIEKILKNIKVRNPRWKYTFQRIQQKNQKIIEIISITIAAQIFALPIIILKFNNIGLSFLITNLLLSAVIGIIVMGGFIQIIISFIFVQISIIISRIIEIPIKLLILISKIQFGNFKVITIDTYQIIIYYTIIVIFFNMYKIFNSKNLTTIQIRIKNTIYLVIYKIKPYMPKIKRLITIIILISIIIYKIPKDLKIYFIDVNQGDATLIVTPYNQKILIDGGGSSTYNIGKNILEPYLLDRKINCIDYIILSHMDEDHVKSSLYLLQEIKVNNVIIGKQFENSQNYKEFIKIVKEKKINVQVVEAGQRINIEKNLYFDVLWPNSNKVISENNINNNSLVCKMIYKDFSILFTGDIEEVAEKAIVEEYIGTNTLKSTILKVAHHGSKSSSSKDFLDKVKAKIALIGVGANNIFGHPNNEVLERLNEVGSKIYRTDEYGEIIIKSNGKNICIKLQ